MVVNDHGSQQSLDWTGGLTFFELKITLMRPGSSLGLATMRFSLGRVY